MREDEVEMAQKSTSKCVDLKHISAETNFRDTVAVDGFSYLPMDANCDTDSRSLMDASDPMFWEVP